MGTAWPVSGQFLSLSNLRKAIPGFFAPHLNGYYLFTEQTHLWACPQGWLQYPKERLQRSSVSKRSRDTSKKDCFVLKKDCFASKKNRNAPKKNCFASKKDCFAPKKNRFVP